MVWGYEQTYAWSGFKRGGEAAVWHWTKVVTVLPLFVLQPEFIQV